MASMQDALNNNYQGMTHTGRKPQGLQFAQDIKKTIGNIPGRVSDWAKANPMEAALTAGSMVPGIGDAAGLGADVVHYWNNPKDITPTNLGISAVGAALPFVPGFAGIFAGKKALTANSDALDLAKRMESDGASRDEIWKATGDQFGQPWVNDAKGGGWKFEIDDSSSRIAPKGEVSFGQLENVGAYTPESRLGDNIWHQGLYDGYPKISEINTSLAKADYPSGSFHSTTMNEKPFRSEIKADGADLESIKSTLLHEGQHGVQEAEGFARGGSSTGPYQSGELDAVTAEIFDKIKLHPANKGESKSDLFQHARKLANTPDMRDKIYRRLAGEAEARNVQTRIDYPMQQRIDEAPWTTLDVPENELIFRGNGNNKSMINALQGKDRNP